jgi:hypothetical protein
MKRLMLSVAAVALGLFVVGVSFGHGPQDHGRAHGSYGKSRGSYGGYSNSHGGYGHGYKPSVYCKPPIYCQPPVYKVYCPPPCDPYDTTRYGGYKGQPKEGDPRFEEQGQERGQNDVEDRRDGDEDQNGGAVDRGGELEGQDPALRAVRKAVKPSSGATLKKNTSPSSEPAKGLTPIRRSN